MCEAASLGRDRCEWADPHLTARAQQSLRLLQELRQGLETGELQAWFMPMVNLTDGKVIWKRPFTRYLRGAGGSYRGRQFSLELTRDAVIATSQDNFAKFRDIRSLATGAKLATRVYP